MKIKPEHYAHMLAAIKAKLDQNEPTLKQSYYIDNKIGKDPLKRHRWDLMHSCRMSRWLCDNVYPYANDDHIDTALKAIIKELQS